MRGALFVSTECHQVPENVIFGLEMRRQVCKTTEHLFTPVLEVSIPLLRCIRCDVYAYHDTVKQLARNRSYKADHEEPQAVVPPVPYWRRWWLELRRALGAA